jgi:hypothetical protein
MNLEHFILQVIFLLVKVSVLKTDRFKLDFNPIAPVYWVSNTEVFINEENRSVLFDVVKREVMEVFERSDNQVHGYINGELMVCEWENIEIDSPEEFSTHLLQKRKDEVVLDIELKPTTSVIECNDEIILKTVPPIEEKMYEFDDELVELEEYYEDMLSFDYKRLLSRDDLGNYWITEFKLF